MQIVTGRHRTPLQPNQRGGGVCGGAHSDGVRVRVRLRDCEGDVGGHNERSCRHVAIIVFGGRMRRHQRVHACLVRVHTPTTCRGVSSDVCTGSER